MPERECGEAREKGGLYACCGTSPNGKPVEEFLIDPPTEWLEDPKLLINHPQPMIRMAKGVFGNPVPATTINPVTHKSQTIYDLYVWVGEEYYSYAPVYVEEVRRLGISRRIPTTIDLSKFISGVSMIMLVHPKAFVKNWAEMSAPMGCPKNNPKHTNKVKVKVGAEKEDKFEVFEPGKPVTISDLLGKGVVVANVPPKEYEHAEQGPCFEKLYDLIPESDSSTPIEFPGQAGTYKLASGEFLYYPTGEQPVYRPAVFGWFPLQSFQLVKESDGTVPETAEKLKDKLSQTGFSLQEVDE